MAIDLARQNPGLLASPGLPSIVAQIRAVLSGEELSTDPIGTEDAAESDAQPGTVPDVAPASRAQPAGAPGGPTTPGRTQVPAGRTTAPRIGEDG